MKESYRTVLREDRDEFTVQKSRFIGWACPCETEQQALTFLQKIREAYRDASHHCYAYIIGTNQGIMRYSDDGEPGGTAGMPIMDVLRNQHLVNCCVVVIRYFGGILLGTGGLVRAYTQSAKLAVTAAAPITMEWTCRDLCEVPYSAWDTVRYTLDKLPARAADLSFGAAVSFTLLSRQHDRDRVLNALMNASGRQLETLPEEEGYESWETQPEMQD